MHGKLYFSRILEKSTINNQNIDGTKVCPGGIDASSTIDR